MPKSLSAADKLALLLVGYLAVRTVFTDPHGTGMMPFVNLVLWYIMPLGIYFAMRQTRFGERENTIVLASLTAFGLYLAAMVIAERFEVYGVLFPRYIVTSMADKTTEFVGRGRGPLLHPIITGIQLAACFFAVLMFWPRAGRFGRCGILLAAAVFSLSFYSTMTRSVWMGASFGLVVIAGVSMPRSWRAPRGGRDGIAGRPGRRDELGPVCGLQTRQELDRGKPPTR